jgi:hypothetical protein
MLQLAKLSRLLVIYAVTGIWVAVPAAALAAPACSDVKVKRLAREGKTIASIARSCKMDRDEVRDILEAENDSEDGQAEEPPPADSAPKLRRGTPLAPCGCWGFVPAGHRQPAPSCSSGFAVPRMCPQVCPAGGYAWQGVCG